MKVLWRDQPLMFEAVGLHFDPDRFENTFAHKNNKTVAETLAYPRYRKFEQQVKREYAQYLIWELGKFLFDLKSQGDLFYLAFLNQYGDSQYRRFYIEDEPYLNQKGLYIYTVHDKRQYIGRCRDTFKNLIASCNPPWNIALKLR